MCRTIYRPIVSDGGEYPRGMKGYEALTYARTPGLPGILTRGRSCSFSYVDLEEEKHLLSAADRDPEFNAERCGEQ